MKYKSVVVLILAFFLLLGGAYLLYGQLSQGQSPDSLVVHQPTVSQPEEIPVQPEMPPADPTPEIQSEPKPEKKPDPIPAPEPEAAPTPKPDPQPEPQPEPKPEPDSEAVYAPDFTVYDKQGNPVRLSDFKGKPIVLNFWASWCGPCKSEMPDFEAAYKELNGKVQFLMISATDGYQETLESASSYVEGMGYTFPVYYDTKMEALSTYGIYAFPTTFFINAEGELVAHAVSALSRELLRQGIDMILTD